MGGDRNINFLDCVDGFSGVFVKTQTEHFKYVYIVVKWSNLNKVIKMLKEEKGEGRGEGGGGGEGEEKLSATRARMGNIPRTLPPPCRS